MTEYSTFVESVYRLHRDGKLSDATISKLLKAGKITEEEFNYIMGL